MEVVTSRSSCSSKYLQLQVVIVASSDSCSCNHSRSSSNSSSGSFKLAVPKILLIPPNASLDSHSGFPFSSASPLSIPWSFISPYLRKLSIFPLSPSVIGVNLYKFKAGTLPYLRTSWAVSGAYGVNKASAFITELCSWSDIFLLWSEGNVDLFQVPIFLPLQCVFWSALSSSSFRLPLIHSWGQSFFGHA